MQISWWARRRLRARAAAVLGFALVVTVSGCASPVLSAQEESSASDTRAQLPALTGAEQVRDHIARSETAISERAQELSTLATKCETCAEDLRVVHDDALLRLDLSGGNWQPWGDFGAQSGAGEFVELPAPNPDAPYQVGALAAYMVTTAREQAKELAVEEAFEPDTRMALGSLLLGRWVSGLKLAQSFDLDLAAELDLLPEEATLSAPPSAIEESETETAGSGGDAALDETGSPRETPEAGEENAEESQSFDATDAPGSLVALTAEEEALTAFDCVRSRLLTLPAEIIEPGTSLRLAKSFEERAFELRAAGISDKRGLRCLLPTDEVSEMMEELLRADLLLFGSPDAAVRSLGFDYMNEDVSLWARLALSSAPTVTLMTPVEGNESE